MTFKKTCAVCGREFEARANNAKYCSDPCRYKATYARWKDYEELRREMKARHLDEVAEERKSRKRMCKGCKWRSWVDHTKCVMPTCMARLGL